MSTLHRLIPTVLMVPLGAVQAAEQSRVNLLYIHADNPEYSELIQKFTEQWTAGWKAAIAK